MNIICAIHGHNWSASTRRESRTLDDGERIDIDVTRARCDRCGNEKIIGAAPVLIEYAILRGASDPNRKVVGILGSGKGK